MELEKEDKGEGKKPQSLRSLASYRRKVDDQISSSSQSLPVIKSLTQEEFEPLPLPLSIPSFFFLFLSP